MIDFSQISSTLQSLLGGSEPAQEPLLAAISAAGLDIEALRGLAPDDLLGLLADHGVDVSSFSADQLGGLISSLGADGQIADAIGQVLDRFKA